MNDCHYYSNYADCHDIDCYFRIGKEAYHFASNGNLIPGFITMKVNIAVQNVVNKYLQSHHADFEVSIHREQIKSLIHEIYSVEIDIEKDDSLDERYSIDVIIEEYASSFKEMATIGFTSMDLDDEGVFHVIASQSKISIPEELLMMLPEVSEDEVKILR